jgi:predicted choloylglycine hydrolase
MLKKLKLYKFIKILIVILILSLVCYGLSYYYIFSNPTVKIDSNLVSSSTNLSQIRNIENIKVLSINGSSYEAGLQHGKLLRSDIQEIVNVLYTEVLPKNDIKKFAAKAYITLQAKEFDKYIPDIYRQEMQGVADGAGVEYNDILIINTFDDILNMSGCSSISIEKSSESEYLIHARNLDYNIPFLAKHNVIFEYLDQGFVSFGFPGFIGAVTGVNQYGTAISSHTSKVTENSYGTPTGIVYRQILEHAENINDSESVLRDAKRTIGNNLLVSNWKENLFAVFEINSKNVIRREHDRFVVSTNHYISSELDDQNLGTPNSHKRFDKLYSIGEAIWSEQGKLQVIQDAMSDNNEDPSGWSTVANIGTVQSVIMIPEKKTFLIAKGISTPVTDDGYVEYTSPF